MQTNSHMYRARNGNSVAVIGQVRPPQPRARRSKQILLGVVSVFALTFGLACQSTTKGERTETPAPEHGKEDTAAAPEKPGTIGASATSPASAGKTRKHGGVCGCKEDELCVSATAINDMRCVPDVACDPFDCSCFSKRGFTDPCPKDFSCQSTNWPLVTCVRTQGSEP